jgi:type III pantothenate kinase
MTGTLLLDLGNTRLKWAWTDASGPLHAQARAWDAVGEMPLAQQLNEHGAARRVFAASVTHAERQAEVEVALRDAGAAAPVWVGTPAQACGVRNGYRRPQDLGVDRFLGMVAALHAGCAPCIVVSAGTALTLDALAADGLHLGGLIAPGPQLMQQSLREAARHLPDSQDAPVLDCADDTAAAMASGCWQAALGLIERFHARMRAPLGGKPELVLGGGDALTLAGRLALPATVQADAVLQGLAVWAAQADEGV